MTQPISHVPTYHVRAWAAPDEPEVDRLAAWMWRASRTDLRQGDAEGDQIAADLWAHMAPWMQGYWRAHARGYLIDRAQRGV